MLGMTLCLSVSFKPRLLAYPKTNISSPAPNPVLALVVLLANTRLNNKGDNVSP